MTIDEIQNVINLTNDATEIINRAHYTTTEHLQAADSLTAINRTIRAVALDALARLDPPQMAREAARRQRSRPG